MEATGVERHFTLNLDVDCIECRQSASSSCVPMMGAASPLLGFSAINIRREQSITHQRQDAGPSHQGRN
jgi:hypothetical protein